MTANKVETFSGVAPRVAPRLLPNDMATDAVNCKFESGQLRALRQNEATAFTVPAGTKTLFRYSDTIWFTSDKELSFIRSPIAEDPHGRVYWTGDTYPRFVDVIGATTAPGGGGHRPPVSYRLGLPRPLTPSVAISGTPTADAIPVQLAYTVTLIADFGEESQPALVTPGDIVEWREGQTRTITLPAVPTGAYPLTAAKWRIYRTNFDGDFQFVGEVAVGTPTFVDTASAAALGEILPSQNWDPPPDEVTADHPSGQMTGIIMTPGGSAIGFSGKTICPSVQFLPHAYPPDFQLTTQYDIVGGASVSGGVVVLTVGKPSVLVGDDPSSMVLQEVDGNYACVSKRSIVDMGDVAIYAGPDGLVTASVTNGFIVSSEPLMTREQWQALKPETIHAYYYDGRYVGFFDKGGGNKGGFIYDPRGEKASWSWLDFYADAGYHDLLEGELYLLFGTNIVRFDAASTRRTYKWSSKEYHTTHPVTMTCARVDTGGYPVTLRIFADGTLRHTQTVTNANFFRLPSGQRFRNYKFEVEGSVDVNSVAIAESPEEL